MKKCPFCKADIDDNARFCLYCMTPLVEKEEPAASKRRLRVPPILIVLLAGILLAVGVGVFMIYRGSRDPQGGTLQVPPQTSGTAEATPSDTDFLAEEQTIPEQTEPKETSKPGGLLDWLFPGTVPPDRPTGDTTPKATTVPTTEPTTEPTTAPSSEPTTAPTTEATTAPTRPVDYGNGIPGTEGYRTQLAIGIYPEMYEEMCILPLGENQDFMCHLATSKEMNNEDYVNQGDEYITSYPCNYTQNGICYIPAYMYSGGKIIAIGKGMGAGDVVSVFLPETIVYITKDAFYHRDSELAYVHIKSDMLDIHENAFPPMDYRRYTIVLRTSAQCKNSKGEYYKDIAGRYGCVWEEWNG